MLFYSYESAIKKVLGEEGVDLHSIGENGTNDEHLKYAGEATFCALYGVKQSMSMNKG